MSEKITLSFDRRQNLTIRMTGEEIKRLVEEGISQLNHHVQLEIASEIIRGATIRMKSVDDMERMHLESRHATKEST